MIPEPTVRFLLNDAQDRLQHLQSARIDAEILLARALKVDRAYLFAHDDYVADPTQQAHYIQMLNERARGKPIAHITGQREFWSMCLQVNEHTLIPRPETEHLVECALEVIPDDYSCNIADLGTGSGAVALAIAKERPHCRIIATDICNQALQVASRNATRLGIQNISFQRGHWCSALQNAWLEIIVSNPPYIEDTDPHLEQGDLRFEPRQALASGPDGLEAIREILASAHSHLRPGGYLFFEHGYQQGTSVRELMRDHSFSNIRSVCDHAGLERVTGGQRPYED